MDSIKSMQQFLGLHAWGPVPSRPLIPGSERSGIIGFWGLENHVCLKMWGLAHKHHPFFEASKIYMRGPCLLDPPTWAALKSYVENWKMNPHHPLKLPTQPQPRNPEPWGNQVETPPHNMNIKGTVPKGGCPIRPCPTGFSV